MFMFIVINNKLLREIIRIWEQSLEKKTAGIKMT